MKRGGHMSTAQLLAAVMIAIPAAGFISALVAWHVHGTPMLATFAVVVLMYLASGIGIEVGFHRYFCHRAFKTTPTFRFFLGALGSIAGQGPVLYWVAVHRVHHRYSDQPDDPHSPTASGKLNLFGAHIGWMLRPRTYDVGGLLPDLLRDRVTMRVQRNYFWFFLAGLLIPALAGLLYGGPWGAFEGFLWGGLTRMFINHQATWSINSICHVLGRRPYQTEEGSRNFAPLCLLSLGGSWHNNHHAFPYAARNDLEWWQLDPSAWFIMLSKYCGLVWDVRVARIAFTT